MNSLLIFLGCSHLVLAALEQFPIQLQKLTAVDLSENPSFKIYNGTEAEDDQFKFMVLILINSPQGDIFRCSGSLVGENWILLAAHCLCVEKLQPKDVIVIGGKAKLGPYLMERLNKTFDDDIPDEMFHTQERRASEFHIHPNFTFKTMHNDLALIRLKSTFNESVKVVNISQEKVPALKECLILGWGLSEGNQFNGNLKFIRSKRVKTTQDGCVYKESGPFICLEKDLRGICHGDSGSPLMCDEENVWGVASHIVSRSTYPDCGDSLEEYYSDMSVDYEWVKSIISGGSQMPRLSLGLMLGLIVLLKIQTNK